MTNSDARADRHPQDRRVRSVLFLNHTATLGGGEIALFHLVTKLDHRRYRPVVVLFSDGPLAHRLQAAGVETRVMRASAGLVDARKDALGGRAALKLGTALRATAFCLRLARVMRAEYFALVHTNSLKSDVLGGIAARLACRPIVWHVRDRISDDYLPAKVARAFRLLCRLLPSRVIFNSHATRRTVVRLKDDNRFARRTHVVHDGTLLGGPVNDRAMAALAPSHFVVGLVGRITRWKGQDVFLRAAASVLQKFPGCRFQIVGAALFGEDDFERDVHELAKTLGIIEAVEFTGFRTDVPDLIASLDVLVHASVTGEPFGQVVIEGMAAGKPVVATNGGGIPEIVVDGETGLLVPMKDHVAMADAICTLLGDGARRRAIGAAGRQRVRDRFLVEHVAQNVMTVYDEMLSRRR